MKVSCNVETAAPTASHNDRTMYTHGYANRGDNRHWTCYGKDVSSEAAEARYYSEHLAAILEEQNERARKMGHSERVMTMDEYRKKHPGKEAILQLGDIDEQPPDDEYLTDYAVPRFVQLVHAAGGVVISIDIHNDEATPHAHVRYIMLDAKGKVNVKGCLEEHGIQRPEPDKPASKRNNPAQTFLHIAHATLEDAADEYLKTLEASPVDRQRQERGYGHEDVGRYKARKRHEEEMKRADQVIADKTNEAARIRKQSVDMARRAQAVYSDAERTREDAEELAEATEGLADEVTRAWNSLSRVGSLKHSTYCRLFDKWLEGTDATGTSNAERLKRAGVQPGRMREVAEAFLGFFAYTIGYVRDAILGKVAEGDKRLGKARERFSEVNPYDRELEFTKHQKKKEREYER